MPTDNIENISSEATEIISEVGNGLDNAYYEINDLNPNHTIGIRTPSTKKGDVAINDYLFDDNNAYANNNSGVEIDGFLFFPESVKGDESFSRREFKRTKIMSGGEFVTRGQYKGREYSFKTVLDIDPNNPNMYDKIFQIMENKPCEVVSPYMGDIFNAEIEIDKTHPKSSPSSLELNIKVKEIVTPSTTVVGDSPITYPSTTALSNHAISVKVVNKENEEVDELAQEREQTTYDLYAKDNSGKRFESPYD